MAELPRVKTTENVLNVLTSPQGDGIAAMLCTSTWGPLDEVQTVSSLSDFKKKYGIDVTGTTGYKGASAFFDNGGTLKVIRVAHTGYDKAEHTFDDGSAVDAVIITATHNGTYGNSINVTIIANGSNVDVYISNGDTSESYYNLATNAAVVVAINTGDLCTAAVASGSPDLVAPIVATFLTSGNDGVTSLADADYTAAFDTYLATEDFRYLIIPGQTANAFQITMKGKLDLRATNEKKYSRYITGITADESITTIKARTLSGKRATLVSPSYNYYDTSTSMYITMDGSYLGCAIAGKLCGIGIGLAGTNKEIIAVVDTVYNRPEQSELLDDSVSVVANLNGAIRYVKDMTRFTDLTSPYKLGVVVDEVDYARSIYETYLEGQLGQPNTSVNRSTIQSNLNSVSTSLINDGVIESAEPSTVELGASADKITATITIKPVYSIDYIDLVININ